MKKLTYLLAATAVLTACNGNQGYTVTGTVEGAAEGDTVYLAAPSKDLRSLEKIDSTTIQNGTFVFTGKQDTVVNRYVTYKPAGAQRGIYLDFFLENGKINLTLTNEVSTAAGTANNDTYQALRNEMNEVGKQLQAAYVAVNQKDLTEEELNAKKQEFYDLREKQMEVLKNGVRNNIATPVGVHLLKANHYNFSSEELEELVGQVSAEYANDPVILKIKEKLEKEKATAVGQKFTDFAMKDMEGNDVKLSDYAGKGKLVLVDFWASWCGPCRAAMPDLVELYKANKGKNFEIVGVSLDDNLDKWKGAVKDLNITWPQMSDLKGWQCEGARIYAVNGIPHVMLIDGEGTIVARNLHGEELKNKVAELLK